MNNKILRKLDILQYRNTDDNWINKDSTLYAFLKTKEMYIIAYENLKSNKKALTPGTDSETLDGFSEIRIQQICDQMKDESFKFDRAKRIYIPKSSGKLRPLGIPSAKDKIVQEVVRLLLQAIWDSPEKPTFKEVSHGFRPGKSTHSALQYVDHKFKNMKWLIEGDIQKAYDSINHEILLKLLEKRIQPGRFLRLIRKSLNAGYLEMNVPVNNDLGTPQGSVVSPILANIYLHELDVFICKQIEQIKESEKTMSKARNPEYEKRRNFLRNKERLLKKLQSSETFKEDLAQVRASVQLAKKQLLEVNVSLDTKLPVRIKYVRYADDWIIGVDGSLTIAKQIKKSIQEFLEHSLKLQLNKEKTKITHLKSDEACFLGYVINVDAAIKTSIIKPAKVNLSQPKKRTYRKRTTGYHLKLKAPIKLLIRKLAEKGFCTNNGFPTSRKAWTVLEDHVIVSNFNAVLLGLLGYYSGADNQKSLRNIQYILQFSCAMTLGHKHRKGIPKIFRKFGKNLTIPVKIKLNEKNLRVISFVCLKLLNFSKQKKTWRVNSQFRNPFLVVGSNLTKSKLGYPCFICESRKQV